MHAAAAAASRVCCGWAAAAATAATAVAVVAVGVEVGRRGKARGRGGAAAAVPTPPRRAVRWGPSAFVDAGGTEGGWGGERVVGQARKTPAARPRRGTGRRLHPRASIHCDGGDRGSGAAAKRRGCRRLPERAKVYVQRTPTQAKCKRGATIGIRSPAHPPHGTLWSTAAPSVVVDTWNRD